MSLFLIFSAIPALLLLSVFGILTPIIYGVCYAFYFTKFVIETIGDHVLWFFYDVRRFFKSKFGKSEE